MASSPKDKFDAAVKVIRGLPKNGPFQPSHELLLKFYSYYKQATEGPCKAPKPSFWDIVNKKKWEAWTGLGDMAREKAMILYVDELKKVSNRVRETYFPPEIVETMPQTEEVTQFLQKLDTFYEMVEDQENHNVKGSQPNGNILNSSGNASNVEVEELNYSENVTMLLKQDMKRVREANGLITPQTQHAVKEERVSSNGSGHENGQVENGSEDPDFVPVTPKREIESPTGSFVEGNKSSEVNGSNQAWSDSETDYEEFCDTSDDVIKPFPPSSHGPMLTYLPSNDPSSTSTPIPKFVGNHPHFANFLPNQSQARNATDSLLVNVSENTERAFAYGANNANVLRDDSEDPASTPKGLIHCRGGDESGDRDRRKRAYGYRGGSHGAGRHEAGSSGSGGHGGADGSSSSRGHPSGSGGGGEEKYPRSLERGQVDLNEQIVVTLLRLQQDMSGVLNRLNSLEALVKEGKMEREKQALKRKKQSWWPFNGMTFNSVAVIFLWPLFVHIVLTYLAQRRRRFTR